MTEISKIPGQNYAVWVGEELEKTEAFSSQLCAAAPGGQLALVSDSNVYALYGARVTAALQNLGLRVHAFVFPAGEESKSAENYFALLQFLARRGLTRADALLCLGGGVAGDLGGFAAATYLRGIALLQMPTSLLAMIDAAVGGKTAIDLPQGKNLAGAFYAPQAVFCSVDFLDSLPQEELCGALAEAVKYGLLGDTEIFSELRLPLPSAAREALVCRCVRRKRAVVAEDFQDRGQRQLLNLGHTVGHAVEQYADYRLSHGVCVAIGMAIVTRCAVAAGLCPALCRTRLEEMLDKLGLPQESPYPLQALLPLLGRDKKRGGDTLTLVHPTDWGRCTLLSLPMERVADWLEAGWRR